MIYEFQLETPREDYINITGQVQTALRKSGIQDGMCVVFCPHTTAGITINENADPDVVEDMLFALSKMYPDRLEYKHAEGNTTAHLKAGAIGSSVTMIIDQGKLILGTWQGIYFCEFDGPRSRKFYVKILLYVILFFLQ